MASLDYSNQLANLKNAQKKAAVADLQNTRNQALSNLNAEQTQNAANYAAQRSTANAQNRLSARNFQEYLANTGRANSGLGAQANMQSQNNLNTSLNNIYGAENAANADILRRRTDAMNAYNTGLAGANANIEANYIQALLDEKARAFERQMAEKEFKENVRQFNENLKLQKRNFSSGSGGGSSRSRARGYGSSGYSGDDVFTNDEYIKALADASIAKNAAKQATKQLAKGVKTALNPKKAKTSSNKKTTKNKTLKTNKTNLKIQLTK